MRRIRAADREGGDGTVPFRLRFYFFVSISFYSSGGVTFDMTLVSIPMEATSSFFI